MRARRGSWLALFGAAFLGLTGAASASRPPNTAVGGGYAAISVGQATAQGTTAHIPLSCRGSRGATCFVIVRMFVRETRKGKVIPLSDTPRYKHTSLLDVGATTVSLGVGRSYTLPLPLYPDAKRLLHRLHTLPAHIEVQNGHFTVVGRTTVTFGT